MKKLFLIAPALLLAGSLMAAAPSEDGERGPGMDGSGMHEEGPGGQGGDPVRMKEKLGLSAEQVKKLKAMRESDGKELKALRRKMRDLRAKLEDQVEDKASDAALEATLKEMKSARKEMQAATEKKEEAMSSILTATQRAKMMTMHGGRGGHKKGGEGRSMEHKKDKR